MTNGNECAVGSLLDTLAEKRGLTLEGFLDVVNEALEAAGVSGVSRTTFWRWRNGERSPDREQAIVMEDVFGIAVRAWPRKPGKGTGQSPEAS